MRNKRTLQRGLALLLAGGMALSNLGAVPALAEEYASAPETVQATPETAVTDDEVEADTTDVDTPAEETVDDTAEDTAPASEISLYTADTNTNADITALSQDGENVVAAYAGADGEILHVDFSTLDDLANLDSGWTITTAGGTVELGTAPDNSKALAITHNINQKAAGIAYDGLDIKNTDYSSVTITEELYIPASTSDGQFCLPYFYSGNGTIGYTLLVDKKWDTYKAHVGNSAKATQAAVDHTKWQTVSYTIDLKSNTFSVFVDGNAALQNASARNAISDLAKLSIYSGDNSRGTIYVKNISVSAEKIVVRPERPEHEEAKAYYISSTDGDDSYDGTSPAAAWKTLGRASEEKYIPGDQILLKRGDTWTGETLAPTGSGEATNYIKIAAYGDKSLPLPKISANGDQPDALYLYNSEYWDISQLDISNTVPGFTMAANDTNPTGNVTERDPEQGKLLNDYRGIHIAGNDVKSLKGFNIHDLRVHDVSGWVSWIGSTADKIGDNVPGIENNYGYDKSKRTGGILIESLAPTGDKTVAGNNYTVFSDITIKNCEFVNNSFGGIIVKQYNNDSGRNGKEGWANRDNANKTDMPDYYDPDWHPHTNIVITGNYINQGASAYACNGVYLCGVKDSVVEKNVLEHIGTCGIELFYADNVAIQYNEISDVAVKAGGQDSNAIDPDWRTSNILIQYNYVRDCGEGLLLCGQQFNSGIIRYNLLQDITGCYVHYAMVQGGYFQFYNNVFYRSAATNAKGVQNTNYIDRFGNGRWCSYVNNVFYDAVGEGFDFTSDNPNNGRPTMTRNAYNVAANSKDKNAILLTEDPFLSTSPDANRGGTAATGALLEANGLRPKLDSVLYAAGVTKDGSSISIDDGLSVSGTKFNFTPLREQYDMNEGKAGHLVYIDRTDYPLFDKTGTDAALGTNYTQRAADAAAPSIGLFERVLTESDIILSGTVTDETGAACPDAPVTVTVDGKVVATATTDSTGSFRLTNESGLIAGEATVTATVDGKEYTETVTLAGAASQTVAIVILLPEMPSKYSDVVLKASDNALNFTQNAVLGTDGRLALTPIKNNKNASYAEFSDDVKNRTAVDFSFDYQYQNGTNKTGFQFRDSNGNLLFAMCINNASSTAMRTPTDESLLTNSSATTEPKWIDYPADASKTYVVRVHADFAAGTVSYQLKDKATGQTVIQKLNVPTNAKNLARMYNSSWYESKTQYVSNFTLTARESGINTTALKDTVDSVTTAAPDENAYTPASWAAYQSALAAAQAVLADPDTQKSVDDAKAALAAAYAALIVKTNKTTLQAAYDANVNKANDNYTDESWANFTAALADAKAILDKDDATQAEVDAAAAALTAAVNALTAKPTTPDEPDNKPTDPDNKPSEPGTKPDEPDNKPSEPDHNPDTKPGEPETPTQPTTTPKPTQAPTATPNPGTDTASTAPTPKATTTPSAPAAQAATIPQTADTFPLTLVLLLTISNAAALTGLTVYNKKKH